MTAPSAHLPNRDASVEPGPGHRPLSAIAAAAGGGVPQARIRRVLADVALALAPLHEQGRVHGAIALNTIGLDSAGKAHVLVPPLEPTADAEGGVRFDGYAAFEQYTDDPDRPCGPWTDLYALSAVAHAMMVGAAPPGALARCVRDAYAPLAGDSAAAYDPEFRQAVDRGLAMSPQARPQNIEEFARVFGLDIALRPAAPAEPLAEPPAAEPDLPPVAAAPKSAAGPRVPLLVMLGVLAAVALAVYLWLQPGAPGSQSADRSAPANPAPAPAQPEAPVPTPPALSELGAPRPQTPPSPAAPEPSAAPAAPAPEPGEPATGSGIPAPDTSPESPVPGEPAVPAPESAQPSADTTVPESVPAPAGSEPATPGDAPLSGDPAAADGAAPPQAADPAAGTDPAAAALNPDGTAATTETVPPEEEKPAEPPQPATVSVRVNVRPWGEVLIDGRSRGISPPLSQVTLPPGRHSVTIRNPAAPDYNTTINISPGGSGSISHVFE